MDVPDHYQTTYDSKTKIVVFYSLIHKPINITAFQWEFEVWNLYHYMVVYKWTIINFQFYGQFLITRAYIFIGQWRDFLETCYFKVTLSTFETTLWLFYRKINVCISRTCIQFQETNHALTFLLFITLPLLFNHKLFTDIQFFCSFSSSDLIRIRNQLTHQGWPDDNPIKINLI